MLRSLALALALLAAAAPAAAAHTDAEIFATDNTAVITDPDDPRLDDRLFDFGRRVERIIEQGGGRPRGSELLDGVFAAPELTFERSRRFDVDDVSDDELHDIAETIRRRHLQQSVLTFDRLHPGDPDVDAVELEVPGVSARALREGLLEDAEARERLFGGSVTLDRRLLLVAALEDAEFARGFAKRIGGDLRRATHPLRRPRVRRGGDRRPRPDREGPPADHRHRRGRHGGPARGPAARDRLRRRRHRRLRGLTPPVRPRARRARRGPGPADPAGRRSRPPAALRLRLRRADRRRARRRRRPPHRRRPHAGRHVRGLRPARRRRRGGRPRHRQHQRRAGAEPDPRRRSQRDRARTDVRADRGIGADRRGPHERPRRRRPAERLDRSA